MTANKIPNNKRLTITIQSLGKNISLTNKFIFRRITVSPCLCGFSSIYGTQHALSNLLFNWQDCLEKIGQVATILLDLSIIVDSLTYYLIIANLHA